MSPLRPLLRVILISLLGVSSGACALFVPRYHVVEVDGPIYHARGGVVQEASVVYVQTPQRGGGGFDAVVDHCRFGWASDEDAPLCLPAGRVAEAAADDAERIFLDTGKQRWAFQLLSAATTTNASLASGRRGWIVSLRPLALAVTHTTASGETAVGWDPERQVKVPVPVRREIELAWDGALREITRGLIVFPEAMDVDIPTLDAGRLTADAEGRFPRPPVLVYDFSGNPLPVRRVLEALAAGEVEAISGEPRLVPLDPGVTVWRMILQDGSATTDRSIMPLTQRDELGGG